jgi:ubiquinone/menaquinone biosynthesis C-methylase UbiE
VLRAINPRHTPTQDTLDRLLRPFKLRLTLAPLEIERREGDAENLPFEDATFDRVLSTFGHMFPRVTSEPSETRMSPA